MEKLAAFSSEATNYRRCVERSIVEIDKIDAPLTRSGIVEAQRLRLNVKLFIGAGYLELFEVCVAVEQLLVVRDSVVFDPHIGVVEAIRKSANMRFPVADEEIKIVGAVALREVCGIRGCLR